MSATITPIRAGDRPPAEGGSPPRRLARRTRSDTLALDIALAAQRDLLFQAMGIVGLAALAARATDAADMWKALEGAYALIDGVAGKLQSADTLLAGASREEARS